MGAHEDHDAHADGERQLRQTGDRAAPAHGLGVRSPSPANGRADAQWRDRRVLCAQGTEHGLERVVDLEPLGQRKRIGPAHLT